MNYYYADNHGQQIGPITLEELKTKGITKETKVWHEGLPQWINASEMKELQFIFSAPPPLQSTNVPPPMQQTVNQHSSTQTSINNSQNIQRNDGVVRFIHKQTGVRKTVSLGFNWIIFLFNGFFGIPLFVKGLNLWGIISIATGIPFYFVTPENELFWGIFITTMIYSLFLGVKSNEYAAQEYLKQGFQFEFPDSPVTIAAKKSWNIY